MAATAMVPEAIALAGEAVSTRHRILIAAAVAAVVGSARITDVRPAAWTRRRPRGMRQTPSVRHSSSPAETEPEEEEAEES